METWNVKSLSTPANGEEELSTLNLKTVPLSASWVELSCRKLFQLPAELSLENVKNRFSINIQIVSWSDMIKDVEIPTGISFHNINLRLLFSESLFPLQHFQLHSTSDAAHTMLTLISRILSWSFVLSLIMFSAPSHFFFRSCQASLSFIRKLSAS